MAHEVHHSAAERLVARAIFCNQSHDPLILVCGEGGIGQCVFRVPEASVEIDEIIDAAMAQLKPILHTLFHGSRSSEDLSVPPDLSGRGQKPSR